MIELSLKRGVGQLLWNTTAHSAALRGALAPYGLRADPAWSAMKTAAVRLATGRTARLCAPDRSWLTFELHWKGWRYFSPYTVLTALRLAEDAETFFDVGANVGYYALTLASARRPLKITAFEPNPRVFQVLCANAALNAGEISCREVALSDRSGELALHLPHSALSASLEPGFNPSIESVHRARTVSLDDHVADNPVVGRLLIKVIIEGHEPSFLRGAAGVLARLRPDMLMAVSRAYDPDVVALLRQHGYGFYRITDEGLVPESTPAPCVRGPWFFLEHLVTTRPAHEVAAISARLVPRFAELAVARTNCNRPDLQGAEAVWG